MKPEIRVTVPGVGGCDIVLGGKTRNEESGRYYIPGDIFIRA